MAMGISRRNWMRTAVPALALGTLAYSQSRAESDNRLSREPDRAERMRKRLVQWEKEVRAPRLKDFPG